MVTLKYVSADGYIYMQIDSNYSSHRISFNKDNCFQWMDTGESMSISGYKPIRVAMPRI